MRYPDFPRRLPNALFEFRSNPDYGLHADVPQIFASEFAPATRAIVTRLGPTLKGATLLDRHQIGTCFHVVRTYHLHIGESQQAADYFLRQFGLSSGTRTGLFLAADLATGLERTWIEGASKALALETAVEICRGDPMLASWIRRLLYEQAPDLGWLRPHKAMSRAVLLLKEHLWHWPGEARAPSEDDVLGWLDLIRRDRPLPAFARSPLEMTGAPSQGLSSG